MSFTICVLGLLLVAVSVFRVLTQSTSFTQTMQYASDTRIASPSRTGGMPAWFAAESVLGASVGHPALSACPGREERALSSVSKTEQITTVPLVRVSAACVEVPVEQVVTELEEQAGMPVQLRGAGMGARITILARDESLAAVLDRVVGQMPGWAWHLLSEGSGQIEIYYSSPNR